MHSFIVRILLVTAALIGSSGVANAGRGSPPTFSEPVQTSFRVPLGTKQFKLICPVKTDDDDSIMIQWKKDDEQINLDFNNRYKLSRSDKELRIRSPQISDSGTYQCQAINGFGHAEMDFALIVFDPTAEKELNFEGGISLSEKASPPVWMNETEMRNSMLVPIRLSIGRKLVIRCPVRGNPLPQIEWYRNNQPVKRGTHVTEKAATFIISSVKTEDSGRYVCRVQNIHGMIEATFRVRVGDFLSADDDARLVAQENELEQSPVIDEPLNTTVRIGHTAQFQCKVKSHHYPLIRWLKRIDDPDFVRKNDVNATMIFANNMHLLLLDEPQTSADLTDGVHTNRLVIPNVNYEHAGTYICVVTNANGDIVYRSAQLDVISKFGHSFGFYFYIGIPVVIAIFCLIAYAIYFLCRNQESEKESDGSNEVMANSIKTVRSIKSPSSSRPPPPNVPPPKAPLSPSSQQKSQSSASNTRYPLLMPNETNDHLCYPTADRVRSMQHQIRPMRRTRAVDDPVTFYNASSPQSCWTQTSLATPHVENREFDCTRDPHQFAHYFCDDRPNEQQQPFLTPSMQRRSLGYV